MNDIKLSAILPSYKDPLLHKTIDSLLENSELGDRLEVIPILDGYWPEKQIKDDPRIRIVHLGRNRGMRGAINAGVSVSRGEYIARFDEHIMVGPSWDKILTESCKDNWIMTPRRFALNPIKWEIIKDIPPVDYEKLALRDDGNVRKFEGQRWHSRTKERKDIMIDETYAIQGSCWLIKKSWWDKVIKELDTEHYGPLIQDSVEMTFLTWRAGGKLVLNKNTWFAHKHVSFSRTHNDGTPENPARCKEGYKYALEQWEDYYLAEIKPRFNIL